METSSSLSLWDVFLLLMWSPPAHMQRKCGYFSRYVLPELQEWCQQWNLHLQYGEDHSHQSDSVVSRYRNCTNYSKGILVFLLDSEFCRQVQQNPALLPVRKLIFREHIPHVPYVFVYFLDVPEHSAAHAIALFHQHYETDLCRDEFVRRHIRFCSDNRALWKEMRHDFKEIVSMFFQERIEQLWKKRNPAALATLIEAHTKSFVGRQKFLQQLHNYVHNESLQRILVLYGEPGIGKSALLAQFYRQWCERPQLENTVLLAHFSECGGKSAKLPYALRSLCQQLEQRHRIDLQIPYCDHELIRLFPRILEKVKSKTILLLDGLDQFEPTFHAHHLHWLPGEMVSRVKIIATAGKGLALHSLLRKTCQKIKLSPFAQQEVAQRLEQDFSDPRMEHVPAFLQYSWGHKVEMRHPQYLEILLRTRTDPIWQHQPPLDPVKLFDCILDRLVSSYEGDYPGFAEFLCCLLQCSRYGLQKEELENFFQEEGDVLRTILLRLKPYLHQGDNKKFFAIGLAPSIARRFLSGKKCIPYHKFLARYYESQPLYCKKQVNAKKLLEQPWQQMRGYLLEELVATLCDIEFIEAKARAGLIVDLQQDYRSALIVLPENFRCEIAPGVAITRETISLLGRIIDLSQEFLQSYPQCIFQVMWNYGYWHDNQRIKKYCTAKGGFPPWQANGPKLFHLVEHWREYYQERNVWLRACSPLPRRLELPRMELFTRYRKNIRSVCFSREGDKIAAGAEDRTLRVWDAYSNELLCKRHSHPGEVAKVKFSHDGRHVVSCSIGSRVEVRTYNCETCDLERCLEIDYKALEAREQVVQVDLHLPSAQLLLGTDRGCMEIRNIYTGKPNGFQTHHRKRIRALCFDAKAKRVASSSDQAIQVWDAKSSQHIRTLSGHKYSVYCLAFSPDGNILASGSYDNSLCLWDVAKGKQLKTLQGHSRRIYSVSFSADGSKLISGSSDETIRIWNVSTGELLEIIDGWVHGAGNAEFSPEGDRIVSGYGREVRVWNLRGTDLSVSPKERWRGEVSRIGFTANGKRIVLFSTFGSTKIWDAYSGESVETTQAEVDKAIIDSALFHPHYVVHSDAGVSMVMNTKNLRPIAFFPMELEMAQISVDGVIAGVVDDSLCVIKVENLPNLAG